MLYREFPKNRDTSYFLQYASDNTSQGGEDGIIGHFFAVVFASNTQSLNHPPVCVDVGAWDGMHLSNTFTLLHDKGWSGYLFEADSERSASCALLYKDYSNVKCINALVDLDGTNSLGNQMKALGVPQDFEFLSVDIDGADYYIWEGLLSNADYRPKLVCIEFNPTIPNRVYFTQDKDIRVHQGSSLLAFVKLGKKMGYTLMATTNFNAFFLRDDYVSLFPEYDKSLDNLNLSHMSTELFQTYDGELKYVGPLKLLWHRLAINPQKLQVLPKRLRKFPFAPISDGAVSLSHISSLKSYLSDLLTLVLAMPSSSSLAYEEALVKATALTERVLCIFTENILPLYYIADEGLDMLLAALHVLCQRCEQLTNSSSSEPSDGFVSSLCHTSKQHLAIGLSDSLHARASRLCGGNAEAAEMLHKQSVCVLLSFALPQHPTASGLQIGVGGGLDNANNDRVMTILGARILDVVRVCRLKGTASNGSGGSSCFGVEDGAQGQALLEADMWMRIGDLFVLGDACAVCIPHTLEIDKAKVLGMTTMPLVMGDARDRIDALSDTVTTITTAAVAATTQKQEWRRERAKLDDRWSGLVRSAKLGDTTDRDRSSCEPPRPPRHGKGENNSNNKSSSKHHEEDQSSSSEDLQQQQQQQQQQRIHTSESKPGKRSKHDHSYFNGFIGGIATSSAAWILIYYFSTTTKRRL